MATITATSIGLGLVGGGICLVLNKQGRSPRRLLGLLFANLGFVSSVTARVRHVLQRLSSKGSSLPRSEGMAPPVAGGPAPWPLPLPAMPTEVTAVSRELAETERAYLRDLEMLSECKAELPELPLASVDALKLLHTELAAKLGIERDGDRKLAQPPSVQAIAQAFLYMGPFLRAYQDYVSAPLRASPRGLAATPYVPHCQSPVRVARRTLGRPTFTCAPADARADV